MDEIWIDDFRYSRKEGVYFSVWTRKLGFWSFCAKMALFITFMQKVAKTIFLCKNGRVYNFYVFSEKKVSISDFLNFYYFYGVLDVFGRFWTFWDVFGRFMTFCANA